MSLLSEPPDELKILIVDDQLHTVRDLGLFLEGKGYFITYASNLSETLDILNSFQPDLILLDLLIPVINGIEICQQIKGNDSTRDIPILFLTASRDEEHLVTAFEAGAVDYVMKPFRDIEVLTRINTQVKLSQQTQSIQQAKEKLDTIVNHVQDGLLVIDQDGIIQFVNPAAVQMFNKPIQELVGHNFGRPIVLGSITQIKILRLNGDPGTAEITCAEARWEGKPASVVSERDISDRQDLVQKLLNNKPE